MSDQDEDGYFPMCLVCGRDSIGPAVCLDPTCHAAHEGEAIDSPREKYIEMDGHAWQFCQLCDHGILSHGGAVGTYALCVACWNAAVERGERPPTAPVPAAKSI